MKRWEKRLQRLRRSARQRGLVFDLDGDDIKRLLAETTCCICGKPLDEDTHRFTFERVDPLVGYTRANTRVAGLSCNQKKAHRSDFLVHNLERKDRAARKALRLQRELRHRG